MGGQGDIAEAGGALRRKAVREFVGGERGAREDVDGKPAGEVGARRESSLACVVDCWKYPQWIQSYVSTPALTSATASASTSRTTGTTVGYIPEGQSTDRSLYLPLPTKL